MLRFSCDPPIPPLFSSLLASCEGDCNDKQDKEERLLSLVRSSGGGGTLEKTGEGRSGTGIDIGEVMGGEWGTVAKGTIGATRESTEEKEIECVAVTARPCWRGSGPCARWAVFPSCFLVSNPKGEAGAKAAAVKRGADGVASSSRTTGRAHPRRCLPGARGTISTSDGRKEAEGGEEGTAEDIHGSVPSPREEDRGCSSRLGLALLRLSPLTSPPGGRGDGRRG